MAIANLDSLRQRFADEATIKNASAWQHLCLWYAFVRSDPMNMLFPYGEPAIAFAKAMKMQMQGLQIDTLQDNPIVCASCGERLGTLQQGKASTVYGSLHPNCTQAGKPRPLSFLYNMQHIARELGIDYNAFEHHLILLELEYADWKRNYEAAQGSANGFEFISSISCNQSDEQVCSHDNAGGDELSAASSCNQLPLL